MKQIFLTKQTLSIVALLFITIVCSNSLAETVSSNSYHLNNTLPFDQLNFSWPFSNSTNPNQADYPFSSSFGPRLKASDNFAYDFHRGIDIPRPYNTSLYAVCSGKVFRNATSQSGDHYMALRCNNTNQRKNAGKRYVYPIYRHLAFAFKSQDDLVSKGDLIALSGQSDSGFNHLHIDFGDGGSYETNNTHPLQYLSYNNIGVPFISKFSGQTNYYDDQTNKVKFNVTVNSSELDLKNVTVSGVIQGQSFVVTFDFVEMNHLTINKPQLDVNTQTVNNTQIIIGPGKHNANNIQAAYEFTFNFDDQLNNATISSYDLSIIACDVRGSYQEVLISAGNLRRL